MNQGLNKLLVFAVVGLLLLNLGTLVFLFSRPGPPPFGPGHPPHEGGPARIIEEKLEMDEAQKKKFAELRNIHQKTMFPLQDSMKLLKEELFSEVGRNGFSSRADSLSVQAGNIHAEVMRSFALHFADLKNILTESQKAKFESVLRDLPGIPGGGGAPGHHPPHPRH